MMSRKHPLPPLRDQLFLYVDASASSRKAKKLLNDAGITPFVTDGPVEALERKPLVLYRGGVYEGLKEIQSLVDLLEFWNRTTAGHSAFVREVESSTLPR